MQRNMIKKSKGFTLIELLIVIGILAVLAVTLLLALNPAEAQKRTRDTKRLRDAATLQAIINQFIESGQALGTCLPQFAGGCDSSINGPIAGLNAPQPCNGIGNLNWLNVNVCAYAQTVPVDPNNGVNRTFLNGAGNFQDAGRYRAAVLGSNYEIAVYLEAEANRAMLSNDAGDDLDRYELFSGPNNIY